MYSLFRYDRPASTTEKDSSIRNEYSTTYDLCFHKQALYSNLLPEVSVVRNLLNQGLDIFATDWGTPSAYDKSLTLAHFVNKYMDKSVDLIRGITNSDKVSLFGYCWGGDLALMYAALHPEKVKSLITIATPGRF